MTMTQWRQKLKSLSHEHLTLSFASLLNETVQTEVQEPPSEWLKTQRRRLGGLSHTAHGCSSRWWHCCLCTSLIEPLQSAFEERKYVKRVVKNAQVRTAFILLLAGDVWICERNPSQLLNIIGSVFQHTQWCHFSPSFKSKMSLC